jgi:hypothetical protein
MYCFNSTTVNYGTGAALLDRHPPHFSTGVYARARLTFWEQGSRSRSSGESVSICVHPWLNGSF